MSQPLTEEYMNEHGGVERLRAEFKTSLSLYIHSSPSTYRNFSDCMCSLNQSSNPKKIFSFFTFSNHFHQHPSTESSLPPCCSRPRWSEDVRIYLTTTVHLRVRRRRRHRFYRDGPKGTPQELPESQIFHSPTQLIPIV